MPLLPGRWYTAELLYENGRAPGPAQDSDTRVEVRDPNLAYISVRPEGDILPSEILGR